jgi:hypothetical protein
MPVFPPVLGVYPPGVGGDQTRAGSVEGRKAPPTRFGETKTEFELADLATTDSGGDTCISPGLGRKKMGVLLH